MDLFRRVLSPWRARRAAEAGNDLREWHAACCVALGGCLTGLRDPRLPRGDIGTTLDQVDRALFRVRDAGSGAESALKRRDPELGRRVRDVTRQIVELRNQTARFLIRAQGPKPSYLLKPGQATGQPEAYQRARQDVGQAALIQAQAVEQSLARLWADLQPLLEELASPSPRR